MLAERHIYHCISVCSRDSLSADPMHLGAPQLSCILFSATGSEDHGSQGSCLSLVLLRMAKCPRGARAPPSEELGEGKCTVTVWSCGLCQASWARVCSTSWPHTPGNQPSTPCPQLQLPHVLPDVASALGGESTNGVGVCRCASSRASEQKRKGPG